MTDEVVLPDVGVADEEVAEKVVNEVAEVVQLDVVVDPVSTVNADAEVTTPSIEPSVRISGGFSGGPIDRLVLTEYVDHVTYRLCQGDVYVFYV